MARKKRIVFYAINGSGVGHLTRLTAIARWMRRYGVSLDRGLEFWFLTSSEADNLLFHHRFASFKLPAKGSVEESGIRRQTYLALAKQWVWHSLGLLQPDLFVVDTFPRGSFGELLSTLDLCGRKAFIYRPVKVEFARRADFQAMLPLYDRIIVPEPTAEVLLPELARPLVCRTEPILLYEREEAWPRGEVRQRFGIADSRLAVYVSAGGGGDPTAEARLTQVIQLLSADPTLHLVVGAGPLYRGQPRGGERMTWISSPGAGQWMSGFDLAVCAAGYNSYGELMQAGLPTIFLPQEKVADEQARRAAAAGDRGAAQVLEPGQLEDRLLPAIEFWRDCRARAIASRAARTLMPRNGAREAAAELLSLILPETEVEAVRDQADAILIRELAGRDKMPMADRNGSQ